MEESLFIGRMRIVEDLQLELGRPGHAVDANRFLIISGPAQVGKTALIDHIWKLVTSGHQPHLWLRVPTTDSINSGSKAREALTKGMIANRSEHTRIMSTFAREAGRVALSSEDESGGDSSHAETDSSGAATALDVDFSARVARTSEKTRIWVQLLEDYFLFNNLTDADGNFIQNPRITLVLEDVDKADSEYLRWLMKEFLPLVFYESQKKDIRLIITLSDDDFLKTVRTPIGERPITFNLEPFSMGEIQSMLERRGISPEKDTLIFNKTRGLPGEVAKEIQAMVVQKHEAEISSVVAKVFRGKDEEQKLWMLQAACLPFISEESMSIFHREEEAQKIAPFVLKHGQFIDETASRGGYHLGEYYANILREYCQREHPENYAEYASKCQQFKAICQRIPSADMRRWLSYLSVFRYFSLDLIKEVFPDDYRKIQSVVERGRDFIVSSKHNMHVCASVAKDIEEYKKLTSFTIDKAITDRARAVWERKEEAVQDEITSLQNSIELEKKKLERAHQDLSKIADQIDGIKKSAERWRAIRANRVRLSDVRPSGNRLMSAIIIEIIGILTMYFSILFQGSHTIPMSAVALALMIYGLFMPYSQAQRKAIALAHNTTTSNPFETAENQQKNRMLHLRYADLQNQRGLLNSRITKLRKGLREKDELLQEPYIL